MTDANTSITYPDADTATAAMLAMPAGAVVAVDMDMYFKDTEWDTWTGVDCEYTAEEVAALGTVERIDLMPQMQGYLEDLAMQKAEDEERHKAEAEEWQDFIKAEPRGNGLETW